MKKLTLALLSALFLIACTKKEKVTPPGQSGESPSLQGNWQVNSERIRVYNTSGTLLYDSTVNRPFTDMIDAPDYFSFTTSQFTWHFMDTTSGEPESYPYIKKDNWIILTDGIESDTLFDINLHTSTQLNLTSTEWIDDSTYKRVYNYTCIKKQP